MRLLPILATALMLAAAPASAAEKLSVLLEWFVNPDHAPLVVAKESGAFARHGLDVEERDEAMPARRSGADSCDCGD